MELYSCVAVVTTASAVGVSAVRSRNAQPKNAKVFIRKRSTQQDYMNLSLSTTHLKTSATMTTEPLLDHDFHSAWGSSYSLKGFSADQSARQLWEQYCRDPGSVDRQYHSILGEYTEKFHEFFKGYWPLSLHAHASDVLVPTTLATLILNAATTCPLVTESPELSPLLKEDPEPEKIQTFVRNLLGWEDVHVRSPRFVVAKGIYGAAYGPLVCQMFRSRTATNRLTIQGIRLGRMGVSHHRGRSKVHPD